MAAAIGCPECGAGVDTAGVSMVGEILTCPDCGVELEVTSVSPVEIVLAAEVEEDWGE